MSLSSILRTKARTYLYKKPFRCMGVIKGKTSVLAEIFQQKLLSFLIPEPNPMTGREKK